MAEETVRVGFRAEWAENLPADVRIEVGDVLELGDVELVVVSVERPVTESGRPTWPAIQVALEGGGSSGARMHGLWLSGRREARERALRELEQEVERRGGTPAAHGTPPRGRPPTAEELLAAAQADPGWGQFLAWAQSRSEAAQCAEFVRTGLYARRRLEEFARRGRWDSLAAEAERDAGKAGDIGVRSAVRDRTVRRLAYLAALRNPTLLPFLFPDGPEWPETTMRADWDLWGVGGDESEQEEKEPAT